MHYFYFSSKRLSPPQQLSSMAAINPAQPSDQRIILYDMYMLVTQSAQLKTSCARPKTVFLVAAVSPPPPPSPDGFSVILISHPNSRLWSRHKSDEPYFSVPVDATPKDTGACFLWIFKYAVIALAAHLTGPQRLPKIKV